MRVPFTFDMIKNLKMKCDYNLSEKLNTKLFLLKIKGKGPTPDLMVFSTRKFYGLLTSPHSASSESLQRE